jgi:integrase
MRTSNYGDKADLKKLKAALSKERNPLNLLIELIVRTGCRQIEAVNLPVDAINPIKGTILILGAKGSLDRIGFVNKAFARDFKDVFGNFNTVHEFFGIRAGDPNYATRLESLRRGLKRHWEMVRMKVLGYDVKLTLHGLRATVAIVGYEELDNDVLAVQEILGHKAIGSTMRYVAISRTSKLSGIIRDKLG